MNSRDIFQYNEIYNTGIPAIDEQHIQLIDILNSLVDSLEQNNYAMKSVEYIIKNLKKYTHYHFDTEMKIWRRFFPNEFA